MALDENRLDEEIEKFITENLDEELCDNEIAEILEFYHGTLTEAANMIRGRTKKTVLFSKYPKVYENVLK